MSGHGKTVVKAGSHLVLMKRNQMGNKESLVKRQRLLNQRPSRPTLKLQEEAPSPAGLACPKIGVNTPYRMFNTPQGDSSMNPNLMISGH